MTLKDHLAETVASWASLGNPSLLERFVLRNGKPFAPVPRIGKPGRPKECFSNAATFVLRGNACQYVEGFVLHRERPVMPILHAWVTFDGDDAMDPTLNSQEYEYFGVAFRRRTLSRELLRTKVYGLLDPGFGLNHRLMFKIDPELEAIVANIKRPGVEVA